MKYTYIILLSFLALLGCNGEDEPKNPLFGKWEFKRLEQKRSRVNHLGELIVDENSYEGEPYCDGKISEVLNRDIDDTYFCNPESKSNCITYVDEKEFIEISSNGKFTIKIINHREDYYSQNAKSHAGHGLSGRNDCFVKVIENSINEERGSFEMSETDQSFEVDFEFKGYVEKDVTPIEFEEAEEDILYEKGEKKIKYEYLFNDENQLVLKFTVVDYYTFENTWYLEKVD